LFWKEGDDIGEVHAVPIISKWRSNGKKIHKKYRKNELEGALPRRSLILDSRRELPFKALTFCFYFRPRSAARC
jgi:hypothetical protein